MLRKRVPKKRIFLKPDERTRLLKLGQALGPAVRFVITIVDYSTFRRWVRKADGNEPVKKTGRPRIKVIIREFVVRLAKETGWGYSRILGELKKLRVGKISRQTVKNILLEHGLDPGLRFRRPYSLAPRFAFAFPTLVFTGPSLCSRFAVASPPVCCRVLVGGLAGGLAAGSRVEIRVLMSGLKSQLDWIDRCVGQGTLKDTGSVVRPSDYERGTLYFFAFLRGRPIGLIDGGEKSRVSPLTSPEAFSCFCLGQALIDVHDHSKPAV